MIVKKDEKFSKDYLNPRKRSIANAIQVFFKDGSKTDEIIVEYPYGHPRRRDEGLPLLENKFRTNLLNYFSEEKTSKLCKLFNDQNEFEKISVDNFMALWVNQFKQK